MINYQKYQGSNMFTHNVDITLCIDVTGSMTPLLDMVKNNSLVLWKDISDTMAEKGKKIDRMRIRIIAFRDYIADKDDAMLVTDFFDMPDNAELLERCVMGLSAFGGGDEPEDGLEALAYAMRGNWDRTQGRKKRHIIVMYTDASTHDLGYGSSMANYPDDMARNFDELTAWWGDPQDPGLMDQGAKRLLLFAPDAHWWSDISECWDNVIHVPSEAGKGLEEVDYRTIVNTICNSI